MTQASEELLRRCDRPNLRTLFRGAAGCVEECQRCGFAYGYAHIAGCYSEGSYFPVDQERRIH